ncbi:MAG: hypothetical protein ACLQQ4_00045 [Bacteroidia bacterium]
MASNASILMLLSVTEDNAEKIVFAYLKELEEIAPQKIHWYSGREGKAKTLWEEKKLKEWCAIADDKEIKGIWNNLLKGIYIHKWSNGTLTEFKFPDNPKRKTYDKDVTAINGLCKCNSSNYPEEYTCDLPATDISFLLGEETNCGFIEGYKYNEHIKPIEPYGLLEEGYLYKELKDFIYAVSIKRGIYWTLSGDKSDVKQEEPKALYGFIQASKDFKQTHTVCIKDLEGKNIIGTSEIDSISGNWHTSLSIPAGKGQFLLQKKDNDTYVCGEKFYLITGFKINTEIVNNVLVDLYERRISITNNVEAKPPVNSVLWNKNTAPDSKQSEIELSDRLVNVLSSLGKQVIFNDPYFFGDLSEKEGQIITTSKGQLIFFNALIIAIAKAKIEKIVIVGNWRSIKTLVGDNKDALVKKYKALYTLIKNNLKSLPTYKLNRFDIIFSNEPFHDRYWISTENEKGIVYKVST